jgi:hypothetical protein
MAADTNTVSNVIDVDILYQTTPINSDANQGLLSDEKTFTAVTGATDTDRETAQALSSFESQLISADTGPEQAPTSDDTAVPAEDPESPSYQPIEVEHPSSHRSIPRASSPLGIPDRVPDLTEGKMMAISEIFDRYDIYRTGWSDPIATYESHMQRAKDLAFVMLSHYFPKSQGFSVEEEKFDVMTANGWNFPLDVDKTQTANDDLPVLVNAKSTAGKKGKKSKKVKEGVVDGNGETKAMGEGIVDGKYLYKPDLFHDSNGSWYPCPFHKIPRERIAGYVVYKRYGVTGQDGAEAEEDHAHTCLAIVIDDLLSKPLWIPEKSADVANIPADIMAYSLGVQGKIQKGYGILMLGKNLEFYEYDNNRKKPMQPFYKNNFAFDMTKDSPGLLNTTFHAIAAGDVLYQNGVVGTGPRKDLKTKGI